MRTDNPTQGFCTCCYRALDASTRFVDFECGYDGAPVLDRDTGTIAIIPATGQLAAHDFLVLCESCVRTAGEEIDFKPERNERQMREIRRLEVQNEHWRSTVKRLQAELDTQLTAGIGDITPRRRKVAA